MNAHFCKVLALDGLDMAAMRDEQLLFFLLFPHCCRLAEHTNIKRKGQLSKHVAACFSTNQGATEQHRPWQLRVDRGRSRPRSTKSPD